MPTPGQPIVSVVMPTYKRHDLLPRAIESVLAQEHQDWELIVSDDEREENPSRAYATELASRDPRVRVLVNERPRGQANNLNNAIAAARGAWIKPLFDDDRLLPGCLGRMLACIEKRPGAVVARCFTEFHESDGSVRRPAIGRRGRLEAIPSAGALLAVFLQDVEIGSPTQLLVRREHVQNGAWFPAHERILGGVDELWYTELLQRGDLLLVNEVLAAHYQTGHETITSSLTPDAFDAEMLLLREMQYPLVRSTPGAPSLTSAIQAMLIERALWRLTHGHVLEGVRMLARPSGPRAWSLASRWVLRRMFPGKFEVVPRIVLTA